MSRRCKKAPLPSGGAVSCGARWWPGRRLVYPFRRLWAVAGSPAPRGLQRLAMSLVLVPGGACMSASTPVLPRPLDALWHLLRCPEPRLSPSCGRCWERLAGKVVRAREAVA